MNLFKRIIAKKQCKEKKSHIVNIPTEISKNRNINAFHYLVSAGFSYAEVRGFLIKLNNLNVAKIASNSDITAPTIYAAAYGKRFNKRAKEILAEHLGMPAATLFPGDEHE